MIRSLGGRALAAGITLVIAAAWGASGWASPGAHDETPRVSVEDSRFLLACMFSGREDTTLTPAGASFGVLVVGPGQAGLSVTNFGAIGNDHDSRAPSFEFPNGSEIEHLIRGGLWIGAVTADDETLVTTGVIDANITSSGSNSTEFVPLEGFRRRSSIPNDPNFDPEAISEEDVSTAYRDFPPRNTSACPLGIEVRQLSLGWSFKPVDDFIIITYTIKNVSTVSLLNVYVGIYGEYATNFKGQYEEWPPPSVSVLFRHKVITWEDSLRLFSEHHCNFDAGRATTYGGLKLLGTRPETIEGKTVSFNWFDFGAGDVTRDTDPERYGLMGNGHSDTTTFITTSCEAGQAADDPVELISVGPYPLLLPGDSLTFAVAVVGGEDPDDLRLNASWAQQAFDNDYVIPQPPPSPSVHLDAGPNGVDLFWSASPETTPDPATGDVDFQGYRIYLSTDDRAFDLVRDFDIVDTSGFNTGFGAVADPIEVGGVHYDYRLRIPSLRDGFRYWLSVTSYDLGIEAAGLPSLESGIPQNKTLFVPGGDAEPEGSGRKVTVYPNPYRGEAAWDGDLPREKLLWFNHLPARCVIRIFTLSGDLVDEIAFEGETNTATDNFLLSGDGEDPVLPGGQAAWDLISKEDQPIASGLYFFAVEDLGTGEVSTGKFLVLK